MTRVIGVFSQKGGSGKTTTAIHGAVQAAETLSVFLADADGQQSLVQWAADRKSDTPIIGEISAANAAEAVRAARAEKIDLMIVDCPPHASANTARLVDAIDFFVVPCKPTPVDLRTIPATVAILKAKNKPFVFVINEVRDAAKPGDTIKVAGARAALGSWGPVCPITIPKLDAYADALADGRAVTEYAPGSKAADRIRAVWQWIFEASKQQSRAAA